ncbi:lysozyme [Pseudomonas sp. MDMC216]|nr:MULTISPECIES: lysozyme [unclassified Pseudomonas]MDI5994424.1 lysozyme [Pseudomonas sp. MDMC216]MDI6008431.1 lysozyme [Pseudomonas sp. MDMC17]RAR40263.1 lysozyme [Pseudomonas sp. MDMC224]
MSIKTRVAAAILIATPVVSYFEGRNLLAYLDPVGIPTICDGWTYGVRLGDVATDAECDEKTRLALEEAARTFERWVPAKVIAAMDTKSIAAFLSMIYNTGPGKPGVKDGFVWLKSGRHSTMLLHLQAGRIEPACAQLSYWVNAGGRKFRGLERRRAAERELCEAGLQ